PSGFSKQDHRFSQGGTMADEFFCKGCKRELTGALELVESTVAERVYTVHKETPDCNWRQCRECKGVICKTCADTTSDHHCRAAAALQTQTKKQEELCRNSRS